jgi:hypothetical protein
MKYSERNGWVSANFRHIDKSFEPKSPLSLPPRNNIHVLHKAIQEAIAFFLHLTQQEEL